MRTQPRLRRNGLLTLRIGLNDAFMINTLTRLPCLKSLVGGWCVLKAGQFCWDVFLLRRLGVLLQRRSWHGMQRQIRLLLAAVVNEQRLLASLASLLAGWTDLSVSLSSFVQEQPIACRINLLEPIRDCLRIHDLLSVL